MTMSNFFLPGCNEDLNDFFAYRKITLEIKRILCVCTASYKLGEFKRILKLVQPLVLCLYNRFSNSLKLTSVHYIAWVYAMLPWQQIFCANEVIVASTNAFYTLQNPLFTMT